MAFVAPGRGDPTGEALAWATAFDAHSFTNNCDAYRSVVVAHPALADAMDFSSRHADVKTAIFDAIDDAVGTGYVPAVAVPTDYQVGTNSQYTRYTAAEAAATYGAKVAHCLWLEVNNIFPWSLYDYDETRLRHLLDPNELFIDTPANQSLGWYYPNTGPSGEAAQQIATCDHSPKMVYDAAILYATSPGTRTRAAADMVLFGEGEVSHGGSSGPCRHIDDYKTDNITNGCFPASTMMAALCRSLNVAPIVYNGKYIGGSHGNVVMLTSNSEGYVLCHGDNIYNGIFTESPHLRRCALFSEWDPLVGQETDPVEIDTQSQRLEGLLSVGWPPADAESDFLYVDDRSSIYGDGWGYMLSRGGYSAWRYGYLTPAEAQNAYLVLEGQTEETGLPEKPSASNSGTEGALTPTSGPLTIDNAWVVANGSDLQDADITGGVVIPDDVGATAINFINCRIDGGGGIGIDVQADNTVVTVRGCEITNCSYALKGTVASMWRCYLHGNTNDLLLDQTAFGSVLTESMWCGNFIDAGSNGNAIRVTTGKDKHAIFLANTIVGTGTAPLIYIDGTPSDRISIDRNWIDGGGYCISHNQTGTDDVFVSFNKFGRNASSGLFTQISGPTVTWTGNTYEDDGTEAASTDTAPL